MRLPLYQVDAFTATPLEGNPCAVVLDAEGLTPERMQAIAREMNLSETAFVLPSTVADVRARYFTPAEEIPLAGHPTVATIHTLVETGRLRLDGQAPTVRLELEAGVVAVDVIRRDGQPPEIRMTQLRPTFGSIYDPAEVLPAFSLAPEDALSGAPIQTVSTGTPQLMIPLAGPEPLARARVDVPRYRRLRESGDFFSPHLFCLGGYTAAGATRARHFGVPPDTMEDPFTGSATGGMAAYLWHHGLVDSPNFVAEQGHPMARPGWARVEVVEPPDDIAAVRVGGHAVTVFEGTLRL